MLNLSIQGEGAPLVLVPGIDGTGKLFYRQTPLLGTRYRVGTFGLRPDAATLDDLVGDLDRVISAVAGERSAATVVGESFGGALSLTYALAHPERVERLVIVNSFPCFHSRALLKGACWLVSAIPWGAMVLARRFTASRLHSRYTHAREIELFLERSRSVDRRGYLGRLRMLQAFDIRHRLGDIRVPTLFVAAEEDRLVPAVKQARYMAARVPGAAMRVLPGHGHVCLIAPGVDLCRILEEWRGRSDAAAARSQPERASGSVTSA